MALIGVGKQRSTRKGKDMTVVSDIVQKRILNVARLCLSRSQGICQSQCSRRKNPGTPDKRRPWFQGRLHGRDFHKNGDLRKGIWEAGPGGLTRLHMLQTQNLSGPVFGTPPG